MTVEFNPESWERGAERIAEDGIAFANRATQTLEAMTTARLNCEGFGTMMDAAFAMIFPPSVGAFHETAAGLGIGFVNVADAMSAIASSYRGAEDEAEATSNEVGL